MKRLNTTPRAEVYELFDGLITVFNGNAATADVKRSFHIRSSVADDHGFFGRDSGRVDGGQEGLGMWLHMFETVAADHFDPW